MHRDDATAPFASALVVTPSRDHLRLDKDFLRRAGVASVHGDTDVKRALTRLVAEPVGLVLLDSDLGQVRGSDVVALLRKRRGLDRTPIVLSSLEGGEAEVLRAVGAGCSGFLLRPYSMESLQSQLDLAARGVAAGAAREAALARARELAEQGRQNRALRAFQTATPENKAREAQRLYEAGCSHLAERRYDQALRDFSRAVAVNSLYAEAYVGMASAYKEMGDPDSARRCMRRAATAHALRDEMLRTRRALADILRETPETENPFLELGFTLVRQGDFRSAGRAYDLARRYAGPEGVHASAARACHFTRDPEGAAKRLAEAMAEASGVANAPALYKRIMGDVPRKVRVSGDEAAAYGEPGPMSDAWAVLKYTFQVFVKGGPVPQGSPIALNLDF